MNRLLLIPALFLAGCITTNTTKYIAPSTSGVKTAVTGAKTANSTAKLSNQDAVKVVNNALQTNDDIRKQLEALKAQLKTK